LTHELAVRAAIGSDQFVYWNAKDPRRCLAPDVFVKLGTPDDAFATWKTWERGTPELAVEILSENEDWADKLERYHELGVRELVSYDPVAKRIRAYDRIREDLVERVVSGSTPCLSLGLQWMVAPLAGDPILRVSRDEGGTSLLPTPEEAALARVAELEAQLRKR
jgi:Uma2 family endonuclease